MSQQIDLLLHSGTIVTMDGNYTLYEDGAVAVLGDSIVAVGATAEIRGKYTAETELDCTGQVIIPGLVNAHTHIPMSLLRGLNDDLRLDVWLGYLMPLEREFVTPEFVRLGSRVACAEMIRSGVTTFADMYYFEDAIAEETAAIGMRALLGQTILTFPTPDAETYEDGLARCRQFIEDWRDHDLIQPAVAPHAWYTATPELLQACGDLAREYDVPLHTHVSESALEVENCRDAHHQPVVPWLNRHGLLDTKLLAAHCVHIDEGEMFKLKKAGAGIAHCPTSNLKLASGIAPVGKMIEMGLNVGVGTDGPASNNDLDMFEETRLAALLAKTATNDPTTLPARQALELATIGGARAVHTAHLTGSLEVGKRADLAVVDMDGIHNQPHFAQAADAVYSRLVYAAKSSDVAHVICNGRFLMRDRDLLTIDEAAAKAEAAVVAAKIDEFVAQRESNPYHKLVLLSGVTRQESFEIQVKVPLAKAETVRQAISSNFEITKYTHYRQYDHYFYFDSDDPHAVRLRYREDEFINEKGEPYQERTRLTLIGEAKRQEFARAVMLSRSTYLADADRSLRFYREYFTPVREVEVHKDRWRWRIVYQDTEFAINLDQLTKPDLSRYYLEIKARTWSRQDAEKKAALVIMLLEKLGLNVETAERREYFDLV